MLMTRRTIATGETVSRHMSDRWAVTMATAHSGYPASGLLTDNTARYALAWNHRESGTWIHAVSDVSQYSREIGVVSLLGLNRIDPTFQSEGAPVPNKWRVRIDQYPLSDRVRPGIASISNLVNLTGVADDIRGPIDPPTPFSPSGYAPTKLEATNPALDTGFRVTFDNHHATERALTGQQYLRIHAADSGNPATLLDVGRVQATIVPSSGSSVILSSNSIEVTSEGYIFNFPWMANQLTVPTATVRVDIVGTSSGGTVPEFLAIEWVAELAGVDYDSGLLDCNSANVRVNPDYTIPASATRYVLVTFSDFGNIAPSGLDHFEFVPNNSWPLQVGKFLAAETISELQTVNDGWVYSPQSNAETVQMRDGSERFPTTLMSWDEYEMKSESRTEDQAVGDLLLTFFRAVDVRWPFLIMPYEDDPRHDRWVRFVPNTFELSGGGVKAGTGGTGRRWNLEARVREHTARAGVRG